MTLPLSDAELLARHQRRRRWMVRVTLYSMLVLFLLVLGGLALASSGMSIEEAEAVYKQLNSENATLSKAESVFGKAFVHPKQTGEKVWFFTKSSLNTIEVYLVCKHETEEESVWLDFKRDTLTGWDAWKFRWWFLKVRLGIYPDEYPS